MKKISAIYENEKVLEYLQSRQIAQQYIKAKSLMLSGYAQKFDFKLRKPKTEEVYQFRINQKYRAFGYLVGEGLYVYLISDHQ